MREIIEQRLQLLAKAKNSKELQGIEVELCKRDIMHWFNNYVYTDKNKTLFTSNEDTTIPFIPFDFQIEAITEIWASIMDGTRPIEERKELLNIFIEKSRQMGLSWIIVAIFVYWFVFHDHKYLMISQKEDDVDKPGSMKSLFEKARFILKNLPQWMLPPDFSKNMGTQYNKYMTISRSNGTGSITGESANPNASRSGTYDAIFMDEMAFMQNATTINTAAASATPCRIFNSTPNWEGNEFYRMRKLTQWRKDANGKDIPPEVKGLRYHWSENKLYTSAWYESKIRGMSPEKIAQELEISYNTALMGRVYTDFPQEAVELKYIPEKPMYLFIDNSHWWKDPHAIIIAQLENHYINIIDYIEMNCSVTDVAEFLSCKPKFQVSNEQIRFLDRYKQYNWQKATFISDPYDTHSTLNQSTIFDEYRKTGIYLQIPQERNKKEQIMKTRSNIYRVRYNDNCLDFASAILNARYPDRSENSSSTKPIENPIHDWTSHARTALEYWIVYLLENPVAEKKRVVTDTRAIRDYRTWKLTYVN